MTRELLDELSMQLLLDEQADFANAERHRAAMLQADIPWITTIQAVGRQSFRQPETVKTSKQHQKG